MPRTKQPSVQLPALGTYHLRMGWASLAVFATLGLVLESLHGLKLQGYVGVESATRREMWTLAHAHGTLLSLVHLGFVATLQSTGDRLLGCARLVSRLLTAASVCMPLGFFLGGLIYFDGDPGLGILFVPVGAICFIIAAAVLASTAEMTSESGAERVPRKSVKGK